MESNEIKWIVFAFVHTDTKVFAFTRLFNDIFMFADFFSFTLWFWFPHGLLPMIFFLSLLRSVDCFAFSNENGKTGFGWVISFDFFHLLFVCMSACSEYIDFDGVELNELNAMGLVFLLCLRNPFNFNSYVNCVKLIDQRDRINHNKQKRKSYSNSKIFIWTSSRNK